VASEASTEIFSRVNPPRRAKDRATGLAVESGSVEGFGKDRIIDHPAEVGLTIVVAAPEVHLARGELLEAEGATNPSERVEPGQPVQGHSRTIKGERGDVIGNARSLKMLHRLPKQGEFQSIRLGDR
jgi:hypothetical protein